MWADWDIFERPFWQNCLTKVALVSDDVLGYLKMSLFVYKLLWVNF